MFNLLRRMRRDERGQAMVIAVVAMLVLAVSVMASVSIGHGVYEKIKLQDAADAQSYTFAVKEARAYNFLAYTNRAMIVHYSAMLTVMSYVSHAVYLDQTIKATSKVLKALPGIGALLTAVSQAIKVWKGAVDAAAQALIPILTELNVALWLAQESMMVGTFLGLFLDKNTPDVYKSTDPKSFPGFDGVVYQSESGSEITVDSFNFSNLKNFLHVIDDGPRSRDTQVSLDDPTGLRKRAALLQRNALSNANMAKYRLLMGNLANSVRREWTAVGTGPFLLGRQWELDLCVAIGQVRIKKTADSQIKSFAEDFQGNRKDQLYAADDITIDVRPGCGFLPWNTVFELHARVAADARDGFHKDDGARMSHRHHPWTGITPFLTSDTSFIKPWENHFGYPCNIVILSKDMRPQDMRSQEDGQEQDKPFQMTSLSKSGFMEENSSGTFDDPAKGIRGGLLDMTWRHVGDDTRSDGWSFLGRTKGMMAMAVGRAIYHRPGDWQEEPNFFNPLWTARLASVKTHWEQKLIQMATPELDLNQPRFSDTLNY
ncbi:TadE/TadG family type IV pilus assembly protein [Pyxidicoccus sp. MSG2]|uniref:TadE/TadG family type IV pilus assembly protein n=1 Tax=Pyxidicoccus sp. MSG2 TaxID=2996790 RepID=UPI002271166D|nr:pilus assembly protein [Pyxidicoccus sp. MSG2]MCY1017179.1 pilus assembly protein [Pyxidicoccus sp. MSG2]